MRPWFHTLVGGVAGFLVALIALPSSWDRGVPQAEQEQDGQTHSAPVLVSVGDPASAGRSASEAPPQSPVKNGPGTTGHSDVPWPEDVVSERMARYLNARAAMVAAERALLPSDYRRVLPATPQDIEAQGRWASLLAVARELRSADVDRYMRWRAEHSTKVVATSVPTMQEWMESHVAEMYRGFFVEEANRFVNARHGWEALPSGDRESQRLSSEYFEGYQDRLTRLNEQVHRYLREELPSVDWSSIHLQLPVP